MVHMFSLVMFALCSPCSLTNQWDKLPIDLLEVYFPKWELPWRLIWAWRFGTPVPLYYYVLWAMITKVWNPCPSFLLHNVGTDHEGVEPLYYFFTLHCGHWSPRCGTPVLLFYFTLWHWSPRCGTPVLLFYFKLWALNTKARNPCPNHFSQSHSELNV